MGNTGLPLHDSSTAIESWSSDECCADVFKVSIRAKPNEAVGRRRLSISPGRVPSVKVETCYYLGWKLSLYDTLHGIWQDQVTLRSGNRVGRYVSQS